MLAQPEQVAGCYAGPAGFEAFDRAIAHIQEQIEQVAIDPELPSPRGKARRHPAVDRIGDKSLGSRQESAIVRHGPRIRRCCIFS